MEEAGDSGCLRPGNKRVCRFVEFGSVYALRYARRLKPLKYRLCDHFVEMLGMPRTDMGVRPRRTEESKAPVGRGGRSRLLPKKYRCAAEASFIRYGGSLG